jgi:cytochrome c oxidase assembly protein subunit 15
LLKVPDPAACRGVFDGDLVLRQIEPVKNCVTTNPTDGNNYITRRHRDLLLVASTLTFLLVVLGGIVCVTDSSKGCPDWPACYGQLVPPMRLDSILEYAHRVLAGLASLLIVASAILGWLKARSVRWVSLPPLISIGFLVAVIIFGAMVVLRGLSPGLAALDLGSALIVLALVLAATVMASAFHDNPARPDRLSWDSTFARLTLWTLVAVFVVVVSGVLVATSGSVVRCLSWPQYGGPLELTTGRGWLDLARRLLAGATSILVMLVVVLGWREPGAVRRTAMATGLLFVAELVLGALLVVVGATNYLQVVYVALAAAFWTSLVVLVVLVGAAQR